MGQYTKGPWAISHGCLPGDSGFSIGSDNAASKNVKIVAECWPCTIVSEEHRQELFANAKLIKAAPDLLEACKRALYLVEENNEEVVLLAGSFGLLDELRAAIAKATT